MSWVIVRIDTGQAVCELYNKRLVDRINKDKYKAVPVGEWLASLNRKTK